MYDDSLFVKEKLTFSAHSCLESFLLLCHDVILKLNPSFPFFLFNLKEQRFIMRTQERSIYSSSFSLRKSSERKVVCSGRLVNGSSWTVKIKKERNYEVRVKVGNQIYKNLSPLFSRSRLISSFAL